MSETDVENYQYGFKFGPMWVIRLCRFIPRKNRECTVVRVTTDHHRLDVYSSKTGRSVRVWLDNKELT